MSDFNCVIMKRFHFIVALAIVVGLWGCTKDTEEVYDDISVAQAEVAIGLPIEISRTAMSDEGKASWVVGDTFTLWAKNKTGGLQINGANFTMYYYWHTFASAVFTSNTNLLTEGKYTYYAVSPAPLSTNDLEASYIIPAEQQGKELNGAYDIMVATPVEAESLSAEKVNNLALDFNHKTHLFKLTIPQNGNPLNDPISKIVFTFPTPVVGAITVDAKEPSASPTISNGSNQLVVNVPEGLNDGEHAWGRIVEKNISGNVMYYAVSVTGERTTTRTFNLSKMCEGGHITPLSLRIPDPIPPTVLRFKVGKNNLGEAIQKVTIYDHNNNLLQSFSTNANNVYDLVQHGIYEDGKFQTYAGKTFTVRYESQNAIVESKVAIPSVIAKNDVNNIAIEVPYLLFEDFSQSKTSVHDDNYNGSGDSDRNLTGYSLNNYMTILGWNAARYNLNAGKGIRINVRYQSGSWVPERASGRLDTPALSALKPGATVKLTVSFDTAFYIPSGYNYDDSSSNDKAYFTLGTHTNQNAAINSVLQGDINGVCSVVHTSNTFASTLSSNSFGVEMPTYSVTIPTATASTRIVWFACTHRNSSHIAANCCYYMYLDNIKVSIAQ